MSTNRKRIVTGLSWSYAERITAQAVSLLVSIILARLLAPEDFGVIAMVMIFITLCDVIVTGGLGNSLVQKERIDRLDVDTMLICSIVLSVSLYIVIFITAPFIALFFEMPIISPVLRVLGLRIIFSGFNSIQKAWVQKKLEFKKFFLATFAGVLISAFVGILLAYKGFGVWALVAQYLTNTVVSTILLYIIDDWIPKLQFSWERASGMLSYGWKVLVSTTVSTLVGEFKTILIGKQFGAKDLAYFDQGNKFPNILLVNIDATIISVLFPVLSGTQRDLDNLKRICRRSISTCMYLSAPLLIGLICVADDFIIAIYTEKWVGAIPFLKILALSYVIRPLSTMCNQAILALGRSDISLKCMVLNSIISLGLIAIAVFYIGDVIWVAYAAVFIAVINMLLFSIYSKKLFDYSYKEQFMDMYPSIAISIIMGLIVRCVHFLPLNHVFTLMLEVFVGASVYFIISKIIKYEPFYYLCDTIKEFLNQKNKL